MLTPELAAERWEHLWTNRCRIGARSFIDLHSARPQARCPVLTTTGGTRNSCVALQDLEQISRRDVTPWEAVGLGLDWSAGQHDWEEVELLTEQDARPRISSNGVWVPRRDQAAAPMVEAFEAMKSVLNRDTSVCAVISQAYRAR